MATGSMLLTEGHRRILPASSPQKCLRASSEAEVGQPREGGVRCLETKGAGATGAARGGGLRKAFFPGGRKGAVGPEADGTETRFGLTHRRAAAAVPYIQSPAAFVGHFSCGVLGCGAWDFSGFFPPAAHPDWLPATALTPHSGPFPALCPQLCHTCGLLGYSPWSSEDRRRTGQCPSSLRGSGPPGSARQTPDPPSSPPLPHDPTSATSSLLGHLSKPSYGPHLPRSEASGPCMAFRDMCDVAPT